VTVVGNKTYGDPEEGELLRRILCANPACGKQVGWKHAGWSDDGIYL